MIYFVLNSSQPTVSLFIADDLEGLSPLVAKGEILQKKKST